MTADAHDALTYVCLVSDFNYPNLIACLARNPTDILLVVSNENRFDGAARRLERVLHQKLHATKVRRLDRSATAWPLQGAHAIEARDWAEGVLVPTLDTMHEHNRRAMLNVTGGTKALALALAHAYAWDAIDYKPESAPRLESFRLSAGRIEALDPPPLPGNINPLDAARLYVEDASPKSIGPLAKPDNATAVNLAAAIWQAQAEKDPGLRALFKALDKRWNRGGDAEKTHELPWVEFNGVDRALITPWLERLDALCAGAFTWDTERIHLPGRKAKGRFDQLRRWLNGEWLELLAHHWLLEDGLAPEAIERNLHGRLTANDSASGREADFFIHHQHRSSIIEAKADLPPNHAPAELENQISSLGNRFGRTRKALLIAPQLRNQLVEKNNLDNFCTRCKASDVALLTKRAELRDFVQSG